MPINFKNLANSDKDIRDSELELLFKEMPCSQALMDANWKAIFYCFWMSDKPKVQEELAIKIASKVLDFGEMYLLTFWDTLIREWYQIDRIRLNKYYMLIRKFHYFMFEWIKDNEFDGSIFPKIIAKITPVLGILYNATENIFTICAESWENVNLANSD
jgi:ribosomal RNA-processing protein 1